MVYYFTSQCADEYTIYMGKDKAENELLIKYGIPEDVWFHVDDLSSAHVYLRQKKGETLDDITPEQLLECSSLVKANSISGSKMNSVYVVYTRWKNLKKTNDMVDGQVGFHRPQNVRRLETEKNKQLVNAITKTKTELESKNSVENHLYQQQQDRERESIGEQKELKKLQLAERRAEEKQRKLKVLQKKEDAIQRDNDILDTIEKTRQMNMENGDNSDEDDDSDSSSCGSENDLF
mmetsp:Transcript_59606/g.66698  ORF Transcript_59606/g.66698 Transcript_59606/m.66698 type:complete len:235 (+) Transcript_59606:27-731(+)